MRTLLRLVSATLLAALVLTPLGAQTAPAQPDPALYGSLHWRHIGPEGNRFSAVAGVPGDPTTYYVGAASGGIYKTTDGGVNWDPIFDDEPVQSIGALAVAQSDPNVVWAGTGEGFIRSHVSIGQGVYKSTDAGATWKLMGLEADGQDPPDGRRPDEPGRRPRVRPGHRLRAAEGARRLPHRRTAAPRGSRCSSLTRTPGAPIWPWTRRTRATSSREPGSL